MEIFNGGKFQGFDNNGQPASYGKLYITDTNGNPATTYRDGNLSSNNTHPIVLTASGKADVFLKDGIYNITLADSDYNTIWTIENYGVGNNISTFDKKLDIVPEDEFTIADSEDNFLNKKVHASFLFDYIDSLSVIPLGTKMLFAQASAPTGWIKVTDWDDKVIRIVNDSGMGGETGGSWEMSGLGIEISPHTLTIDEIPAHTHTYTKYGSAGSDTRDAPDGTHSYGYATYNTSSVGGGQPHTHEASFAGSGDWRPAYLNVICCVKQ